MNADVKLDKPRHLLPSSVNGGAFCVRATDMNEKEQKKKIELVLNELLNRPIAFHPIFAKIGGGVTAGLLLSQAFYWSKHTSSPEGWFYKTREQWTEETMLTRSEQETARNKLKDRGIIEEKRMGVPCKVYYRVNLERIVELIEELLKARSKENVNQKDEPTSMRKDSQLDDHDIENHTSNMREGNQLAVAKAPYRLEENHPTITETKQENTSKNKEQDLDPEFMKFSSTQGREYDTATLAYGVTPVSLQLLYSPPGLSKKDSQEFQGQDQEPNATTGEFQRFYDVARETCRLENDSPLLKLLQEKVNDLITQGFTTEDAIRFHKQWYATWPGTKNSPPYVKQYFNEFAKRLADDRAKHRAPEPQSPELPSFSVPEPHRDRRSSGQIECDNTKAQLLAERKDAGLPPIHCNCHDENGNYLSADLEGHNEKSLSHFRCHHFKWADGRKDKFDSRCGFEVRADSLDNLAPQPDITPEQCQKEGFVRTQGDRWEKESEVAWRQNWLRSQEARLGNSQPPLIADGFSTFAGMQLDIPVPKEVQQLQES